MEDFLVNCMAIVIIGGILFVFSFAKEIFKGKDDSDEKDSGGGTIPAIIAVVLFIGGLIAITALGDSIELSSGAWVPTLLLIVGFIAVFMFVMVVAASKAKSER